MEKLKLIDIARYLPHGLHIENYEKWNKDAPQTETLEVTGLYDSIHLIVAGMDDHPTVETVKPILRPMSDLIVERDGITPIKELAVIHLNVMSKLDTRADLKGWMFEVMPEAAGIGAYAVAMRHEKHGKLALVFERSAGFFVLNMDDPDPEPIPAMGQYMMFDFLDYLKIDYRGLIDDGLAVNVNTLGNSLYKWACLKEKRQ